MTALQDIAAAWRQALTPADQACMCSACGKSPARISNVAGEELVLCEQCYTTQMNLHYDFFQS